METKFDSVQDIQGNAVSGASVRILSEDRQQASITPNPVVTDRTGEFSFSAPNGKYFYEISVGGRVLETRGPVTLYDADDDPPLTLAQAAVPTAASRLGFQTSGTGAAPRTVENKLSETISVKDFGAVGDGIAIDTAAFNDAWASAAAQGKELFVPAGSYLLDSIQGPPLRIYGEGPGHTILLFRDMVGKDGLTFTNPSRVGQAGGVLSLTIKTTNSNGRFAISTPNGAFSEVAAFRPKWSFKRLEFSSIDTPDTTDSWRQVYGWQFCIRLGDGWNAEINTIDALGCFDTAADASTQFLDGFLRLDAQNGILSCRMDRVTTHNIANGVEVVRKAYFALHQVDFARAYRGIYDSADRVFETNAYAYSECNLNFVVINAQLLCVDLGSRFATTISNSIAHRTAGFNHGQEWKGFRLTKPNGCSISATEISVAAGISDGAVGVEIIGGVGNSISNLAVGGGLTAAIRLTAEGDSGAAQAVQIDNLAANGNLPLVFDLQEARGTNISGFSVSSAFTVTTLIQYGNAATRQSTQVWAAQGTAQLVGTQVNLYMVETDAPADAKRWRFIADGSSLNLATQTDAGGAGANAMLVSRTGTTIDKFELRGTTVYLNGGTMQVKLGTSATPTNNGDMVFQKTSNTQLSIKVKGDDGVVRSANIALA